MRGEEGIETTKASYNPTMTDNAESDNSFDPYADELYSGYTEAEIVEMQTLMADWSQATYPNGTRVKAKPSLRRCCSKPDKTHKLKDRH